MQEVDVVVRVDGATKSNIIERVIEYNITLQCSFNRHLNVSVPNVINVDDLEKAFEKKAKTNFTAVMNFYDSGMFTPAVSGSLQVSKDQLFLSINVIIGKKFVGKKKSSQGQHFVTFF